MSRAEAFQHPAPDEWSPQVGETVYVRRRGDSLSDLVGSGTVVMRFAAPMATVKIVYARHVEVRAWRLSDLRPIRRYPTGPALP